MTRNRAGPAVTWASGMLAVVLLGAAPQRVHGQSAADSLLLHCAVAVDHSCPLYEASLLQLITRPELFDGKRVQVAGYIHFAFEGNGIYLHEEDFKQELHRNGLWVELAPDMPPSDACQDRYALVEGRFEARHRGHFDLWSGAITNITRCVPWR